MSAIVGIFNRYGQPVTEKQIKGMNNTLSHRGPDGSGVWNEGPVGLGHQMLHTTPESLSETLPFEENGLVITSDARIDNREELSELLGIEDNVSVSDSYFILKSYQKWGEKCPEKLLGDFAFAILDKNEEKLFCARDHMGVKPFYYYLSDELFIFSTEIRSIFNHSGVNKLLNEQKIAFYLMDVDDNRSTFYQNIYTFPKANSLVIASESLQFRRYWKLDPKKKIIMNSEEEYIKSFQDIFEDSVKCRLRSAFPLGFELSGGLDSSSVVCMAKKIYDKEEITKEIKTFSQIFKGFSESDESFYIQKVIETGNIDPHFIIGDKICLLDEIEEILWCQEQPFFTPFIAIIWKMYRKMNKEGIKVLLGGSGGDSVISYGIHYFRDLFFAFKWRTVWHEIRTFSQLLNISSSKVITVNILFPIIPFIIKRILTPYNKRTPGTIILNGEFSTEINANKFLEDLYLKPWEKANTAKKDHYHTLEIDNLYVLEMLDRTTSHFFIEPRYPFLDKRMVEFCYAIPTEMKFKSGWTRYILRVAMEDLLPKENQWRLQKAFLDQVFNNFLSSEKDSIKQFIMDPNCYINNYVDSKKINKIYNNFIKGDSYESYYIWFALLLELWLQNNTKEKSIEQKSPF